MTDAASVAEAMQVVTAAMAEGTISPDEAQAVANVIEGHRRAIETQELELRIASLESKLTGGSPK